MRRLTVFVLLVSTLVSSINLSSASTPAPGKTCTKIGLTATHKGITFTCQKVGKKILWSKGRVLVKPTSTTSPNVNSATSKSPAPLPTNKEPANETNPTPASSPSPSPSRIYLRGERAALEISQQFQASESKSDIFDFFYSPTTDKEAELVRFLVADLKRSLGYWEGQGVAFSNRISVTFLTERDQIWWNELKPKLGIGCNFDCDNYVFANYKSQPYMGYAGASNQRDESQSGLHIMFFLSEALKDAKDIYWARVMAPHEFMHLVQFQLTPGRVMGNYACWFIEGSARFYERAVQFEMAYPEGYSYQRFKRDELEYFSYLISERKGIKPVKEWTTTDYLDYLTINQAPSSEECLKTRYGYKLGWSLSERFYIDFGPQAFVTLLREVYKFRNWDKAFLQATGVEHKAWLAQSGIPFLISLGQ